MRVPGWVAATLAVCWVAANGAAPAPLAFDYKLTPVVEAGRVTSLAVELHFRGDGRGSLTFDLPDRSMGEDKRWRFLSGFAVSGATLRAPDPAHRVLAFAPGAQVTLRYAVNSAYPGDPKGSDGNPYHGAVLQPGWFAGLGEHIFVMPHDGDLWPATFHWGPLPRGWQVASDLEHGAMGRAMTVADIGESTILGGADVAVYSRPIPGGTLRFAVRGKWPFTGDHLADVLGRTVAVQRAFWGNDVKGPFLVTLFAIDGTGSSGGTGRTDAFALYGTTDTPESRIRRTIAHEHMHSWIPRRIGRPPDGPAEALEYWLSEGFTDFYAERTLLKSGIWSLEDFVADLNDMLLAYDTSPARNAPNARIEKEFWTNYAIEQLPYQRGMLFAYLADDRIRRASGGTRNLDSVMFAMRDAYVAAPDAHKPDLVENFRLALRGRTNVDLAKDLARYIDQGDTELLPAGLFGACAQIRAIRVPVFDKGFDTDKSAATGVFTGVDPYGPAYAAGIREGMRRIAYLAGKQGDSRVDWSYRVADAKGRTFVVRYKPAGKEFADVQEVVLAPGLKPAQRAACVRLMSGG
ncbi:MAG: hypothetical protein WDM86_23170 [Rhizomicrobium sp.]